MSTPSPVQTLRSLTRRSRVTAVLLLSAAGIAMITGCSNPRSVGPYSPMTAGVRDTAKATALNTEAAQLLERATSENDPADLKRAESLLREALNADLYYGPAHNNLGVVFLTRGELYEAASEFEWARKLMPGHPDPRVNLAFTLETAGRFDDALSTYRTALEVLPDDIAAMQGLARLQVRTGKRDEHTARLLREIAMRGESPEWREWAKGLATLVPAAKEHR